MQITEVNNPTLVYTAPSGKEFRTICIEQIPDSQKWINRVYKALFRVLIKYKEDGNMKWLYFDYNDKLIKTEIYL